MLTAAPSALQRGLIHPDSNRCNPGCGRNILQALPSELGSFRGNFKEAVGKLRTLLGIKEGEDLGFMYDTPIGPLKGSRHTLLVCVKMCDVSVHDECASSCP